MTRPSTIELAEDTIFSPISGAGGILINLNRGVYALNERAKHLLARETNLANSTDHSSRNSLTRHNKSETHFFRQLQRAGVLRSKTTVEESFYGLLARVIRVALSLTFCASVQRQFGLYPAFNLVYWSNHLLGFGRTTRIVQQLCQANTRLARSEPSAHTDIENALQETIARCWLRMTCKEIALIALVKARQAGHSPRLVIGLGEFPINLHTWVEIDGQVVTDFADRCEQLQKIHTVYCD